MKYIPIKKIKKKHLKTRNILSHVDRLKLVYFSVISGIIMTKDERCDFNTNTSRS